MRMIYRCVLVATLTATLWGPACFAQDHHDDLRDDQRHDAYVRHDEWKRGYHMKDEDWHRARAIDYRQYHLHAPRRGYEWREVDGNYVEAAVATGVIASVVAIAASGR